MESLIVCPYANGISIDYEIHSNSSALIEAGKAAGFDFQFSGKRYPDVDKSTIIDSEFEADYYESKKAYYLFAGISGLLTGTLGSIFGTSTQLADKGEAALKELIIKVAKSAGLKVPKDSTKEAMFNMACEFLKSYLLKTSIDPSNPMTMFSLQGLALSIIGDLTGKNFTMRDGRPEFEQADDGPIPAREIPGKILYRVIVWFLYVLIADARDDEFAKLIEKNLPKELANLIHELAHSKILSNIANDYGTVVFPLAIALMENVSKNTDMDLKGVGLLKNQAIPVIINECIVRTGYMFMRLYAEYRKGNIKSVKDLMKQIPEVIAPKSNRTLLRMLTISSGTFVAITTACATIKAFAASGGLNPATFISVLAVNVNYVGIGTFVLALRKDIDYIIEDIENLKTRMRQNAEMYNMAAAKLSESFRCLSLNAEQMRILYSLEWQKTFYDVSKTENKEDRTNKINWLNAWAYALIKELGLQADYFIKDEGKLYSFIEEQLRSTDKRWILLVALELKLFDPYMPLNLGETETEKEENKKYKGLKYKASYGHDVFCIKQSVVGAKQYEDIAKLLKDYSKELNNNLPLVFAGVAAVVVVAVASGGAAMLFAPQIATALAGGAVAGLHGAALTAASLAFVGGGALAVGGLGVAGGTAIIVGGGALVGAVVSGASVATIGLLSSKGNLLKECSKLLTYSDYVLLNYCHDVSSVREIRNLLVNDITEFEEDIVSMGEKEKDRNKKKAIENSEGNLKYIRETIEKLDELLKDQPVKEESEQKYTHFSGCKTEEDVKKMYRELMKLYSPDIYKDGGAMARIINEEKEQILDELKRKSRAAC